MQVGVPRESKQGETRVALTPAGVRALTQAGHALVVEEDAGTRSGATDEDYRIAGARVVDTREEVFEAAELVVKVKEPVPSEVALLRSGHILFTFLHLAAAPGLVTDLCASGARCVGYETVEDERGALPLLTPMSEIAGRLATQLGSTYLTGVHPDGKGILLSGSAGVPPGRAIVLGAGTAGTNAVQIALGLGAQVTVFDIATERLRAIKARFGESVATCHSSSESLREALPSSDLVVGAVLKHGDRAPALVARDDLRLMAPGSVLVDISIDQGGCIETSRPTTHDDPVYEIDSVLHYCVQNIPALVPRTATRALTNETLRYVLAIATLGLEAAAERMPGLRPGIQIANGEVTSQPVAAAMSARQDVHSMAGAPSRPNAPPERRGIRP